MTSVLRHFGIPVLALALSTAACSGNDRETPSAVAPSVAPTPSSPPSSAAAYTPEPLLGPIRAGAIDFPMPHMRMLSGWGSMQRGVNMWVVSGTASLEQKDGHYAGVGEVCSIAANWEATTRVRDLMHCYWDRRDKGRYQVLGQSGTVVQLRRTDGLRFTFDMRTGALSRV